MDFCITQENLVLMGPLVDEMALNALDSIRTDDGLSQIPAFARRPLPFHLTVLTTDEVQRLPSEKVSQLSADTQYVFPSGVGSASGLSTVIFFVVVVWAAGQRLRKQLGLPPAQFHILLSAEDVQDADKEINSLLPGQFPVNSGPDFLDHLAFTLHLSGKYENAMTHSAQLIATAPDSPKGFVRLGDAALCMARHKLAMLSYACAFQRTTVHKAQEYCVKKMVECSQGTEWGCLFLDSEAAQLPKDIFPVLVAPWSAELRSRLSDLDATPTLSLEARERISVPLRPSPDLTLYQLPRFFRWLIPFRIALMSTPRSQADIAALASPQLQFRHILTLTEEEPLDTSWFATQPIINTHLPIPNYRPPTIEQMDLILRILEESSQLPLLIHCGGGKGRAGTVAACYLVAYGFQKSRPGQTHPVMSAQDAVLAIRSIRPGSIETSHQEAFVSKWCSTLWKRNSILQDPLPEPPPSPLEIEGDLGPQNDLFMLVGLPGSGKSWLAKALLARNPKGWVHICQDDSGSRALCETEVGRAKGRGRVLLDRCNTSDTDRTQWLKLAAVWAVAPVCVFFDYDEALCCSRAQNRAGHPTLPPGSRVRTAIEHARRLFVRPRKEEGFKAMVVIRSFAAAEELVERLSPPVNLFKFPRTPHILDLGGTTADDVVTSSVSFGSATGEVVITEKVDGANMGLALSPDRTRIVVQNRSHYVNPVTHAQFKKLGLWIDQHRDHLYKVLDRDPHFAQRYILFGEWMYATHSIPYTKLPGRFMAFDLYDRTTDSWADRRSLSGLLSMTTIPMVPVLYHGAMPGEERLRDMVQQPSRFWDGRVEGIYVKVEKRGCVVASGKVVRGDFIAGNEHWTKGQLRVNGLESDFQQT